MTIDQVLDEARRMEPAQRAHVWACCGAHDVQKLLVADSEEGASWRYCETCWTAFDISGSYAVNAPTWRRQAKANRHRRPRRFRSGRRRHVLNPLKGSTAR